METRIKEKVQFILNNVNTSGLKWKTGKDLKHLRTRKEYGHIPDDFSLSDYENVILKIMNGKENDVFLYFLRGFIKDYIVFGDGEWIVIIGEDALMETCFPISGNYFEYLSK